MKLELVTRRDVSYVELQRDKKHSLGFAIKDGTQEDARPVVKSVNINGPAAKSFAIAKDDVLLSVNGFSTVGKKIKDVRRMLDDAGENVNLQLSYKTCESRIQGSCISRKKNLTLRLYKIKGKFGFLLRKCSKYSFMMEYPIISIIKQGTPIQERGHLQDGDRLLTIDNVSLSWMSLEYIASLLQAKEEAEFTFEYSVRVVNLSALDDKVNLEIDSPVVDLGISFRMCDDECSVMYISNVRQGSVAERCGIFSEGDVVLSINDIDTQYLMVSKAYYLMRNTKKCRKISFILNRREETEEPKENPGHSSGESVHSRESFMSGVAASDWRHFNTPVSSNFAFVGQMKYNFQSFCYTEQIKSIDKFQSMLAVMSSLKQYLSSLTGQAFRGTRISLNQNCTSCNNTKHAVKLCTSCLARMNVKSAQSMDALRELVAHFIKFSSNMFDENEDHLVNISLKNVIHLLRETLPNIFGITELQEQLAILAEKISCADTSCNVCDKEIKAVTVIAKQLLLILSIRDNSVEFIDLIEHLVCCLLEVEFPCCVDSGNILNSNSCEKLNTSPDNLSETICIEIEEELLSNISQPKDKSEADGISLETNFNIIQTKTDICRDYLKLTHIQSDSESKKSFSPKSIIELDSVSEVNNKENLTQPKEVVSETSFPSFLSEDVIGSRVKNFVKKTKIWRSLDSLIKSSRRIPNIQKVNRNRNRPTTNSTDTILVKQNMSNSSSDSNTVTDFNQNKRSAADDVGLNNASHNGIQDLSCTKENKIKDSDDTSTLYTSSVNQVNQNPQRSSKSQKRASSRSTDALHEEITADYNSESTSSSSRYVGKTINRERPRTYPDTMIITLKKEGEGFGIVISDKLRATDLPVIDAIEPKSSSHKVGLLKLGDRILCINGVEILKLSSRQFSILKNKALAAQTVTFTIEFDVSEEKYMFGLFDVVLDKSLKIGLIFEEMKKCSPMIITGIEKGSAAHRSGQLFPKDRVTFIKYKRYEIFDPMTSNYNTERNVIITVLRDTKILLECYPKDRTEFNNPDIRVPNPSPCYTNPCFQQEESLLQNRKDFVLNKTAVHSSRKNSLVVDHEVTLYRDSSRFDFGILLSEDPNTGRAYIRDIRPDGPAHKSGVFKQFDRIIEVNGECVDGKSENSVLELLSRATHKVDLLIRRVFREELNEI